MELQYRVDSYKMTNIIAPLSFNDMSLKWLNEPVNYWCIIYWPHHAQNLQAVVVNCLVKYFRILSNIRFNYSWEKIRWCWVGVGLRRYCCRLTLTYYVITARGMQSQASLLALTIIVTKISSIITTRLAVLDSATVIPTNTQQIFREYTTSEPNPGFTLVISQHWPNPVVFQHWPTLDVSQH